MNRRLARTLATAAALSLTLAGCAAGGDKTEVAGGAKIVKKGTLTVCTHLPYKPFQYNEGGKVVGFDVDMMDLVAKKLDLEAVDLRHPLRGHRVRPVPEHRQVRRGRSRHDDHRRPEEGPRLLRALLRRHPGDARHQGLPHQGSRRPRRQDHRRAARHHRRRLRPRQRAEGRDDQGVRGPGAPQRRGEDAVRSTRASTTTACSTTTSRPTPTPRSPPSSTPASSTASRSPRARTTRCSRTIDDVIAESKKDGDYDTIYKKYFGEAPSK